MLRIWPMNHRTCAVVSMTLLVFFNALLAFSGTAIICVGASIVPRQASLPSGWVSAGCYTDSATSRTLKTAATSDVTGMTIEACITFCGAYQFAGLEFGRECYCDNVIESTGTPATDGCTVACTGNSAEICGGADRISVYQNPAASPTTTTTTTTAAPAPTASIKPAVGTYQYKGCFQDGVNGNPRTLLHQVSVPGGVSAESCTAACQAAGYPLAGLEWSQECWCDTYMALVGNTPDSDCNMPCQADATELCGAGNRLAVYEDASATPPNPTACLTNHQFVSTTQAFRFDLQAIPNPGGGTGSQIGSFEFPATSGAPTWFILSTAFINNEAHTFNFASNIFWPDDYRGEGNPIPLPPNAGSSQVFAAWSTFKAYDQYCVKPNPVGPYGPFIGPPTLSVNGHNDLWALCHNASSGRIDVVYSPLPSVSGCQSVVLAMTPPSAACNGCE